MILLEIPEIAVIEGVGGGRGLISAAGDDDGVRGGADFTWV